MLQFPIGSCITGVLPGEVCDLEATATECDTELLTATECTCEVGFNYKELQCIGKQRMFMSTPKL
jgi:hypothetical protein